MSVLIARKGSWVKADLSDMCHGLNMAKLANGEFSHAAIEEMKHWIKIRCTEPPVLIMQGVEFLGQRIVKAAMEGNPTMVSESQTQGCLPRQNGATLNLQTCWRGNGTGAPLSELALAPAIQPVLPAVD
jgi:hypothetical protein